MKKPFTLVEVLVAMAVLSVFLLGLMQFYASTESVLSSGLDRTDMFERARIAMDMMANDLTCVYYSQSDETLTPFNSSGNSFTVCTIRPEKVEPSAKTNIVCVQYSYQASDNTLQYSHDSGDNFSVGSTGSSDELVEGVTNFEVKALTGTGTNLPALVVLRLELVDKKTLNRMKANPDMKDTIRENAPKREFRRLVVIDRGQPKPDSM